jgi:ABC-type transporter Mla MlaB component
MLRMTVLDNAESVTFQLEGTLADCWVGEVERCRQRTMALRRWPVVRFDLTGVTYIDAAGKAYLAAMHRQGAKFVAADCLTKAVVAEISKAPTSNGGRPMLEGEARRDQIEVQHDDD